MKKILLYFLSLFVCCLSVYAKEETYVVLKSSTAIVSSTLKIDLTPYENAFNPSILEFGGDYVLTFRYMPDPDGKPWISYVGIVKLDKSFNLIGRPKLLDLRQDGCLIPSQAEDARIFSYNKEIYIIYNDNKDVSNGTAFDRREMFLAKISYADGQFFAETPLKLKHPLYYDSKLWEKNWTPFVYQDTLLLYYSLNPSEVLEVNWLTGECFPVCTSNTSIRWKFGPIRGGTPAVLVDGEYLGFFHSSIPIISNVSEDQCLWHYFMGAYTLLSEPPFAIEKLSPFPLIEEGFYINSPLPKRVIYPGGFVIRENNIYLAYGKDDHEVWIAKINKDKLMRSLRSVD